MKQQGSKYDGDIKERALALISSGKSITRTAAELNVPKSTVSDWWNTQWEDDEDKAAARREARRASIRKCGRIVDKALGAIDHKVTAAAAECKSVDDGMHVLRKAAKDGVIALTEKDVDRLQKIVQDYTGVGLRELSGAMKDVAAQQQALEAQLTGAGAQQEISVQLTLVDPDRGVDAGEETA